MQIIDAQVHVYERDTPQRPWIRRLHGPDEVTGDQMIAALDAAGIDAAILVSSAFMYGFDSSYALEVGARWPNRFAVVAPVDIERPDIEDFVAAWVAEPLAIGLRVMLLTAPAVERFVNGGADRLLRALAVHGHPLCVGCWGWFREVVPVLRRHSDVQFAIDHLGLYQPLDPPVPAEPFADLPILLDLASSPNIAVKVTGAPTLSHEPFPYADTWPALARVFDAYGLERCMWGTDWTRTTSHLTPKQAVDSMLAMPGLSAGERDLLMGGTLRKFFRWNPGTVQAR